MELVSVIVPFYNCGEDLNRTIQSIFQQSYKNIELLLIDDGSTDNSYEIASKYLSDSVKVLQIKNAGAAIARNIGFEASHGRFIQFMDAGDVLSLDKIKKQVEAIQDQVDRVAVCNYKTFTNENELQEKGFSDQSHFIYSTDDTLDFLVNLWGGYGERNFIQTNSWLVPRSLIEKAGGWRAYRCPDDDGEFFARILLCSQGVIYTPGVFNYYHVSATGDQLSQNKNKKYLQNTLLTIDLKHQYLLNKGFHPKINSAIASQYLAFAVSVYPENRILSEIALKRYKALGQKAKLPVLGGSMVEFCKKVLGWRIARWVRYHLKES